MVGSGGLFCFLLVWHLLQVWIFREFGIALTIGDDTIYGKLTSKLLYALRGLYEAIRNDRSFTLSLTSKWPGDTENIKAGGFAAEPSLLY